MSEARRAKNHNEAFDLAQTNRPKVHGWIQWKGTNVCMDIHCACGELTHLDANSTYHVQCGACGRIYFCNGNIELIELEEMPEHCVWKTATTNGEVPPERVK